MARKAKAVILLRKIAKRLTSLRSGVRARSASPKKERVALCATLLTVREFRLRRIFLLVASLSELGSALLAKCEPMRLLCKPYGNRCFADAKRRVLLDG